MLLLDERIPLAFQFPWSINAPLERLNRSGCIMVANLAPLRRKPGAMLKSVTDQRFARHDSASPS